MADDERVTGARLGRPQTLGGTVSTVPGRAPSGNRVHV
jgi:hypothetical protein